MDKRTEVTIHFRTKHTCGQVFEEILHIEPDPTFSLTVNSEQQWQELLEEQPFEPDKPFVPPRPVPSAIEVKGTYRRMELSGKYWSPSRKTLCCLTCKQDLLFGNKEGEGEEVETHDHNSNDDE
jgi:hypothetical protein